MRATDQSQVTVEEYRALPEGSPRYQLIGGELIMAPAPRRYHQDISRNLEFLILRYLETHPIGKLYDAPFDVVLSRHDVVQPDLCFYAQERLHRLTELGADGAPNLVVEVLSPSDRALDRGPKRQLYENHGVEEYWIIDPQAKTVEIHALQEPGSPIRTRVHLGDTFQCRSFPGLTFDTADIFRE